jgi:hypothetical protein
MPSPFSIRILVADGDPEGLRIIDKMNWTGVAMVFPRERWNAIKTREEFERAGVYILVGYVSEEDDLPTVYVGQADGLRARIDSHDQKKDFWSWAIGFVSNNYSLNRAHITWLEYALVERARRIARCHLDNGNSPTEPGLSESDRADVSTFFNEMLQILPLAGLRAFEEPTPVATPNVHSLAPSKTANHDEIDTIVVPAREEGFKRAFLGQDCWFAIRISGGMISKIKYIAAYQSNPISAITHLAPVARIEPYGEGGKYKLIFSAPAEEISPVPFGNAKSGFMQGPRYTSLAKLRAAKSVSDLI